MKFSKSLINQGLLACLFDSNGNSNMSLRNDIAWQSCFTQKLPRQQLQLQQSYLPWGCYLRQIIDAERVCEDCSMIVARSAIRCEEPSIKRSAEAHRIRSIRQTKRGQANLTSLRKMILKIVNRNSDCINQVLKVVFSSLQILLLL